MYLHRQFMPFGLFARNEVFFHTPEDGASPSPGGDGSSAPPSGTNIDFNSFDDFMNGGGSPSGGTQTPTPTPNAGATGGQQPSGTQAGMPIPGAQQTGATQPSTATPATSSPAPERLPPPPPDLFALPSQDPSNTDPNTRIAALEQHIAALTGYIQGGGQQQRAAEPQSTGDPRTGLLYSSTVDPALIQAMNSDDPAQQANAFAYALNAQATTVHRTLAREVGSYLRDTLVPNLIQHVERQTQQRDYERNVQQEFYGRHSDLNYPAYRAAVVQVAQTMIQQAQAANAWRGWTPEFADAVANSSRRLLGQRPAGNGAPGFTPTGARPGGVNPSGGVVDPNGPDAIADLMGDFGY